MYSLLHCSINTFASVNVVNISRFSSSSLSFPLNDSIYPFSQGLPGSINSVFTPKRFNHLLTALAVNSGPLSDLMCSGIPLKMISWNSWSITSCEVIRRLYQYRQAFPGVFIDNIEYAKCSSFSCPGYHEIITPNMVLKLWPQPDTGTIIKP